MMAVEVSMVKVESVAVVAAVVVGRGTLFSCWTTHRVPRDVREGQQRGRQAL
jgi:hypothetical protein